MRSNHAGLLVERIEELENRLNQIDRRTNNLVREGQVTEVDFDRGLARVDAHGLTSKMLPWAQRAGDVRDWNPPAVGERILLLSPTGEPGQGVILAGGFNERFEQNSKRGAAPRRTIGDYSITETAEGVVFRVGSATMQFTQRGLFVTVGRSTYSVTEDGITNVSGGAVFRFSESGFHQNGGSQTHDGKNVGSSHIHSGVQRGSSRTDPPV